MPTHREVPDDGYWVEVDGDGRMHPYGMFKTVNRSDVEVVSSISDEDGHPERRVLIKDGTYQVWVKAAKQGIHGYGLQPDESVSETELDAINLKHAAIREGSSVSVEEAQDLARSGDSEEVRHALIAWYHAAKADPDIPDTVIDRLREILHDRMGYVDTSHPPTVKRILADALGDREEN